MKGVGLRKRDGSGPGRGMIEGWEWSRKRMIEGWEWSRKRMIEEWEWPRKRDD